LVVRSSGITGFSLWIAVVAALAVIALGLAMRRQARVTA
jgi:hypothetical protein